MKLTAPRQGTNLPSNSFAEADKLMKHTKTLEIVIETKFSAHDT